MSDVLLISQTAVPRLLPMADCIEAMHEVLLALVQGSAILPLRTVIPLPDQRGAFASMPAVLQRPAALGVKVLTVFPANHGTSFDSHQGAVLLFEPEHGSLVAVLDASSITALRTAAVTAVATRALARTDASVLALIGSGVQAVTHLQALKLVRPISHVRVCSRSGAHAAAFAERESARHGIPVQAVGTIEQAVRGADIICTLTSARAPVLFGEWLEPGMHINAIGASTSATRELDSAAVQMSRLYVDRRESALKEAGDFLVPRDEGLIDDNHIVGEIGEVLQGTVPGRTRSDEITLFKSLGLAVEDVAAAQRIYQRATSDSSVPRFALGGIRPDLPAS